MLDSKNNLLEENNIVENHEDFFQGMCAENIRSDKEYTATNIILRFF